MNYQDLKSKQSKEINEFAGIFWAFSKEQFAQGVAAIKKDSEEKPKLVSIGMGGYIRKDRVDAFDAMLDAHKKELAAFRKNERKLLDSLVYELQNHEFIVTHDAEPALKALGMSDCDKKLLKKACKIVLEAA